MALIDTAACSQLLARLRKHDEAYPFLKPVEWKKLGLDDYPEIINQPMDLQTLGRQLRDGLFNDSLEKFFSRLQLIWDNCKTYNDESTEIYDMAIIMERAAHESIRELFTIDNYPPYLLEEEEINNDEDGKSNKRRRQRRASDTSNASQEAPPTKKPATQKSRNSSNKMKKEEISTNNHNLDNLENRQIPIDSIRKDLLIRICQMVQKLKPSVLANIVSMISQEQDSQILPENSIIVTKTRRPQSSINIDMAKIPTESLGRIRRVIKVTYLCEASK